MEQLGKCSTFDSNCSFWVDFIIVVKNLRFNKRHQAATTKRSEIKQTKSYNFFYRCNELFLKRVQIKPFFDLSM